MAGNVTKMSCAMNWKWHSQYVRSMALCRYDCR